jgi:cell division protein FtsW
LTLAGVALVASPALLLRGYRWDRIQSFFNPWENASTSGYQIIQSLIALGSGGLFGLGLGASRQKFLYVPGAHTDAIFAIVGEELGLVGCIALLMLIGTVAVRGFKIALEAREDFGALLAFGITCWFVFQAAINIGGITQTIPLTGVPLPFVSYGGSSMVATLAALGILLNISRYRVTPAERKHGLPSVAVQTTLHTR